MKTLIDLYAGRLVIKNAIADAIGCFRINALSAAAPVKVDVDPKLTLIASRRSPFRDFVKTLTDIRIEEGGMRVAIGRRANNSLLPDVRFAQMDTRVTWLDGRTMKIRFV